MKDYIAVDWLQRNAVANPSPLRSGLHVIATLQRDGLMIDIDNPERQEQARMIASKVKGPDVLMAGLGLGVILRELDRVPENFVRVIEKDHEIIDRIDWSEFAGVSCIRADAFTYAAFTDRLWNTILFDIWSHFDPIRHVKDILTLERKYRPLLKPDGIMLAWVYDELLEL